MKDVSGTKKIMEWRPPTRWTDDDDDIRRIARTGCKKLKTDTTGKMQGALL